MQCDCCNCIANGGEKTANGMKNEREEQKNQQTE